MDFESNTLFAVSCAIDTVLVIGAVTWAMRTRRVARAALLLFALLAVKGMVMMAAGLDFFGVAHVIWLDLVIVLPLTGLVVLVRGRGAVRLLAVLAMLLAPLGAYASFVVPDRLETERAVVPLSKDRTGRQPIKIGVLADLQFEKVGHHERAAVARVMAEHPDVILLPGDYHQGTLEGFGRQREAIHDLFSRLKAPGGVYAVQGDSEGLIKAKAEFVGTGVRLLVNEAARVRVKDRILSIGGVELRWWEHDVHSWQIDFERRPGDEDIRLLVAHRPDIVDHLLPNTRVDLLVAGHTHGGQVQLPLIGPPFTASNVPRDVAAGGLHDLDGRRIYVSRGVGLERGQAPRIRFGAAPEVSIITLR